MMKPELQLGLPKRAPLSMGTNQVSGRKPVPPRPSDDWGWWLLRQLIKAAIAAEMLHLLV
jgi:hypothetical protein